MRIILNTEFMITSKIDALIRDASFSKLIVPKLFQQSEAIGIKFRIKYEEVFFLTQEQIEKARLEREEKLETEKQERKAKAKRVKEERARIEAETVTINEKEKSASDKKVESKPRDFITKLLVGLMAFTLFGYIVGWFSDGVTFFILAVGYIGSFEAKGRRMKQLTFTVSLILGLARSVSAENEIFLKRLEAFAERGDLAAQIELANAYRRGIGVTQDYKTAVKWFLSQQNKAMQLHSIIRNHAQFWIGYCSQLSSCSKMVYPCSRTRRSTRSV